MAESHSDHSSLPTTTIGNQIKSGLFRICGIGLLLIVLVVLFYLVREIEFSAVHKRQLDNWSRQAEIHQQVVQLTDVVSAINIPDQAVLGENSLFLFIHPRRQDCVRAVRRRYRLGIVRDPRIDCSDHFQG